MEHTQPHETEDGDGPGPRARGRRSSVVGLVLERPAPTSPGLADGGAEGGDPASPGIAGPSSPGRPKAKGAGALGGRRASVLLAERRNSVMREVAVTDEKIVEGALEALVQSKFGGRKAAREAEEASRMAERRRADERAAAVEAMNTPLALNDNAVMANMERNEQRRKSVKGHAQESIVQEVFKKRGNQPLRVTEQGVARLRIKSMQWRDRIREIEEQAEEQAESRPDTSGSDAVPEKEKIAKKLVSQAYKLALGRAVDPCGLRHYTQAVLEGELDREELLRKLTESQEYREKASKKFAKLPVQRTVYENRFYPWIAVEDEADEEAGTVQWAENDADAKAKVWQTGNVRGNNRGAEVFKSKIFYSTIDNWTLVTVHKPMTQGIHWFSITKIMQSPSGNKARVGVVVRDCELDSDIQRDLFKDRAWYLDEDGSFWNGDLFISGGATYYARGSVITFKLDLFTHKVSCWVAFKPKLVPGGGGVPQGDELGILCGTADLVPGKQYFAMVNDLYGGSGFEISDFVSEVSEGPKEFVDKERYIRERIREKQQKLGLDQAPAQGGRGGRVGTPMSHSRTPSSPGSAAQTPSRGSGHSGHSNFFPLPAVAAEEQKQVHRPPHPWRKRMDGPSPTFLTRVLPTEVQPPPLRSSLVL